VGIGAPETGGKATGRGGSVGNRAGYLNGGCPTGAVRPVPSDGGAQMGYMGMGVVQLVVVAGGTATANVVVS